MDHLLPRYHVRPPRGFLNDPNGPIVVDGVVHLYFQYRQTTDTAEPVVWGHATSTDLAHWTHHRPAMAPLPGGLDGDGCWSGTAIATDDGIRAFYSGFREGHPLQTTLTALSTDGGASFGPGSEVFPDPEGLVQFRDPSVWRENRRWRLAMGAGTPDEVASVRMWDSGDLATWTPAGTLVEHPRTRTDDGVDTGGMWECPQVLDVDGVRVVLVGAWSADVGITRVLAVLPDGGGDRLGGLGLHPIDDGSDFYAPSVLRDGPRGPVVFGWITEGRADAWWREDGWAGAISLPRELSLGEDGCVLSSPVPELAVLRRSTVSGPGSGANSGHGTRADAGRASGTGAGRAADADTAAGPGGLDGGLGAVGGVGAVGGLGEVDGLGAQLEVEAEIRGAGGFRIRCGREALEVRVDGDGTATIDRSRASLDPRADAGDVVVRGAAADGVARLRLFVDGSVLELFTGTGRVATTRFYPTTPPPWSLETTGDVDVRVHTLG